MRTDFVVGDWHVLPAQCRLLRDGRTVAVRPRVMEVLVYLAEVPGQVVSKDTLLNEVWKTDAVSESTLTRTIAELRQALADSAENPRILETIPKRGYRLIAPVSFVPAAHPPTAAVSTSAHNRRYTAILTSLTAVVVAAVLGTTRIPPRAGGLSNGPAGHRPAAAGDWVLVTPFDNRTGDAMFDDVIEQALERELLNSGFVNVVPRPRVEDVLALMKKPADTKLDATLAREVALRDGGIRAVLTGQISRLGSRYAISTRVIGPADGRTRATISHDAANENELLPTLRRQASDVRKALGETGMFVEDGEEVLAKVTTPSLKALQLYSKAATLMNGELYWFNPRARSRYASAEALLRDATAEDPSFASAWLLLSLAVARQERPASEVQPLGERAMVLSAGVGAVERHFIQGVIHRRRAQAAEDAREYDAAARAFEAVLQLAPDHYWTLLELMPVYRQLGRFDDAGRVVIHAATVRPNSVHFAVDEARAHLRRGDRERARAARSRANALAAEVGNPAAISEDKLEWLRLWEAHEAWLDRDPVRVLAAARRADATWPGNTSVSWLFRLAYVYAGIGRYEDALRVAERLPQERFAFVRDYFARQRHGPERWGVYDPEMRSLVDRFAALVVAGKLTEAESEVADRRRRGAIYTLDAVIDRVGQQLVQEGHYAEGLAQLERLKPDPMGPRYYVVEHMAKARRGLGDTAGAIRELERVGETRAEAITQEGWQVYGWLRCRVLLAELYRESGRNTDVQRTAEDVRTLLALSDSGHPLLRRLSNIAAGNTR